MLPDRLGDFAIEGLLGEGGSSLVYAARLDDRTVALKVLHPDLGLSEREKERFLAEAGMLAGIDHPAVVRLLSSGVLPDGRPFLAMPRLLGRSLASRLATGPIALARAVALFADLASALSALHEKGLIHRDIKPENVFWLEREDRLVLLDLGIARDAEGSPSTTTRAGLARGTPQYMAPERLFGQRASVRTDVYELGLLLYMMLAGRPPWTDSDPQGRLDPAVPADLAARLPEELVRALLDAMALDVSRRPESVHAFLARVIESTKGIEPDPKGRESAHLELVPSGGMAPGSAGETTSSSAGADLALGNAKTELHASTSLGLAPTELHATPRAVSMDAAKAIPTLPSASSPPPRALADAAAAIGRSPTAVVALLVGMLLVGSTITLAVWATRLRFVRSSTDHASAGPTNAPTRAAPVTVEPTPSPSPGPSASASAEAQTSASPSIPDTQPSARGSSEPARPPSPPIPTATASAQPIPSAPPASPSQSATTPTKGPMPASCSALVSLFCTPGSMGTPEECATWKANVDRWRASFAPAQVDDTCKTALAASQSGLAARKHTPIPR